MDIINDAITKDFSFALHYEESWPVEIVKLDGKAEQRNLPDTAPDRRWVVNFNYLEEADKLSLMEFYRRARGELTTFRLIDVYNENSTIAITQAKHDITAASSSDETFTIAGDHRIDFSAGTKFMVSGSAGGVHDADWVVDSVTLSGSNTVITVTGNITSTSATGHILHSEFQLFRTYASGEAETFDEDVFDIQPGELAVEVNGAPVTEGVEYNLDDTTGVIIFTATNTPADTIVIDVVFKFYFRVRFDTKYMETLRETGIWEVQGLHLVEVKS